MEKGIIKMVIIVMVISITLLLVGVVFSNVLWRIIYEICEYIRPNKPR